MYEYKCSPIKIFDGDTVDILIDVGFSIFYSSRVRLYGIDTPESRTRDKIEKKFGLLAKEYLKAFIKEAGKELIVKTHKDAKGKYGRILGELYKKDGSKSVNQIMIEEHYGVAYTGQNKRTVEQQHLENREKLKHLID